MSKESVKKFTKQLQTFVQNNNPSHPAPWIGTVICYSDDLQYCDIQTRRGVIRDVPVFGVPEEGTSAIILFIDDSYEYPVAICNPINVLQQDKVDILKTRNTRNWHNNGDFSHGTQGYSGEYLIDSSILTGVLDLDVFVEYEGKGFSCKYLGQHTTKTFENKYHIVVDTLERKPWGAIPMYVKFDKNDQPVIDAKVTFKVFGETFYSITSEDGTCEYNYYPRNCFTEDGYFAVLKNKNDSLSFTCNLNPGDKEYFKVQTFYQSKDSVLQLTVKDHDTNEIILSVPEALAEETASWKINSDVWMVNRETYPKDDHERIDVTFVNDGDNPIRLDGIMVHDESAEYNYYKSREDVLDE